MKHLDLLTSIYSRWLRANAMPEIGAEQLIMELWNKMGRGRANNSALRSMRLRGQLIWLDRFCYLWQMAERLDSIERARA